jgi:hypothetical protein
MVKHGIKLTMYKLTFFNIKYSVLKNKEQREYVFSIFIGYDEKEYIINEENCIF